MAYCLKGLRRFQLIQGKNLSALQRAGVLRRRCLPNRTKIRKQCAYLGRLYHSFSWPFRNSSLDMKNGEKYLLHVEQEDFLRDYSKKCFETASPSCSTGDKGKQQYFEKSACIPITSLTEVPQVLVVIDSCQNELHIVRRQFQMN